MLATQRRKDTATIFTLIRSLRGSGGRSIQTPHISKSGTTALWKGVLLLHQCVCWILLLLFLIKLNLIIFYFHVSQLFMKKTALFIDNEFSSWAERVLEFLNCLFWIKSRRIFKNKKKSDSKSQNLISFCTSISPVGAPVVQLLNLCEFIKF